MNRQFKRSGLEPIARPSPGLSAAWTLAQREWTRFFRQRNRVIGALVQPIIFWVLFGAGLRSSFQPGASPAGGGVSYDEYFFPGVVIMIVLFTAIFATISIIEDRREGFLQGVLVSPAPRSMVVLGKVFGGTMLAMIQAWLFLLLSPLAGLRLDPLELVWVSLHLFVVGFALTSLGTCIAWRMQSTQGFHAIMSVFLMPMWLLSGAFFPAAGTPLWLRGVITANPLTYGVSGLRHLFYLSEREATRNAVLVNTPSLVVSLIVSLAFALVTFTLATWMARRRSPQGA